MFFTEHNLFTYIVHAWSYIHYSKVPVAIYTRMALSRVHTSTKATDPTKSLLLIKHQVKHTQCRGYRSAPSQP